MSIVLAGGNTGVTAGSLGSDSLRHVAGERLVCNWGGTLVDFPFLSIECSGSGEKEIYVHVDSELDVDGTSVHVEAATGEAVDVDMWVSGPGTIEFDAGRQVVRAQYSAGPNAISLGADTDAVIGSTGDDTIFLGAGDDFAFGYDGDDLILGGPGNDAIAGHSGNDLLQGDGGTDVIDPGSGSDGILVDLSDVISYATSVDPITATLADRRITDDGTDRISDPFLGLVGSPLDDSITGSGHDQWLDGYDGDDLIDGLGGDDTLLGGRGADSIRGSGCDDLLDGGPGPDELRGNAGIDSCYSGVIAGCEIELNEPVEWPELITDLLDDIMRFYRDELDDL